MANDWEEFDKDQKEFERRQMELPKGMRGLMTKCPECQGNQITIATEAMECMVGWCENGHVLVTDPTIHTLYKLVWDFRRALAGDQ